MKHQLAALEFQEKQMPPTRGHDLKPIRHSKVVGQNVMPPTRGHDLKPQNFLWHLPARLMPPTRGHDLKLLLSILLQPFAPGCPPHGGTT